LRLALTLALGLALSLALTHADALAVYFVIPQVALGFKMLPAGMARESTLLHDVPPSSVRNSNCHA
jgi:hypothetical protein